MAGKSNKWAAFPHDAKGFAYAGDALKKAWPVLHAGDCEPFPDAKRAKARHIRPVDQFDMLDPMAGIGASVCLLSRLISVDRLAHCPISDGVHGNLQTATVNLGADRL